MICLPILLLMGIWVILIFGFYKNLLYVYIFVHASSWLTISLSFHLVQFSFLFKSKLRNFLADQKVEYSVRHWFFENVFISLLLGIEFCQKFLSALYFFLPFWYYLLKILTVIPLMVKWHFSLASFKIFQLCLILLLIYDVVNMDWLPESVDLCIS